MRHPTAGSAVLPVLMLAGLAGCATPGGEQSDHPMARVLPSTQLHALVPADKLNTASRQLAAEGLKALDAKDYRKASDIFNLAVKTDMTNSYLHFLNALAYQMRGVTGESGLFPLAEQGYQMAVQFDGSNWLARYYSGLLDMHLRHWGSAQSKLAEAALYAGRRADLLYDLAVASYYNRDPKMAAAALAGVRSLGGPAARDPRVLRASAIVAAALDQREDAAQHMRELDALGTEGERAAAARDRVESWQSAFDRAGMVKTQFPGPGGFVPQTTPVVPVMPVMPGMPVVPGMPLAQPPGVAPMPGQPMGAEFVEKKMAVVDVVILSTEEDNTHSMGVNLLDGLRIQFGNPTTLTPGYSRTNTRAEDLTNPALGTATRIVTRQINMPAVTYSLNVANANAKRNEVLARPTLVALGNQTSNFFSGVDVNAAAVSNGQGSAVQIQKEVGVKLAVTPEFLPDNQIKLNIAAERTFLAIPSTSVRFDFRLDTTKTTVNANVVMKFGETLILSGLSERDQSSDRDGVPLLQDIPIVQYLFSRNVTREYYKSVLILLTPRRAQYTHRDEADAVAEQMAQSGFERSVSEFEERYKLWFKPIPNVGEITTQLERSTLFREFRSGDLGGSWQSVTDHAGRLNTAIRFLYY